MTDHQLAMVELMLSTSRDLSGVAADRLEEDVQDLLSTLTAAEFVECDLLRGA